MKHLSNIAEEWREKNKYMWEDEDFQKTVFHKYKKKKEKMEILYIFLQPTKIINK